MRVDTYFLDTHTNIKRNTKPYSKTSFLYSKRTRWMEHEFQALLQGTDLSTVSGKLQDNQFIEYQEDQTSARANCKMDLTTSETLHTHNERSVIKTVSTSKKNHEDEFRKCVQSEAVETRSLPVVALAELPAGKNSTRSACCCSSD